MFAFSSNNSLLRSLIILIAPMMSPEAIELWIASLSSIPFSFSVGRSILASAAKASAASLKPSGKQMASQNTTIRTLQTVYLLSGNLRQCHSFVIWKSRARP